MVGNILSARYELIERLHEGILFEAYRARDLNRNRLVMLKMLRSPYAENPSIIAILQQLSTTLAALHHPNLVAFQTLDHDSGVWFLVEEFVRGLDLKTRVQRTAPFTVPIAVEIAIGIAEAVEALHRAGIVHGNLSPSSVIVGTDWHVWVNEVGYHALYRLDPTLAAVYESKMVPYMAPELLEGGAPGVSSDLYAFGIILFEMLTGSLPYTGETPLAVARQHLQSPLPSPRSLNPAVPRTVEGIVLKCLQKEPEQRYDRMTPLLQDLKAVRDALRFGKPLSWSPLEPPVRRPLEPPSGGSSAGDLEVIEEEEEEIPGWLRFMLRTLLLIVILGFLVGAGLLLSFLWAPQERPVPKLMGKSLREAQQLAAEAGFRLEIEREDYNEKYPPGTIYFMNQTEGRALKRGATIKVWVSQGSRFVKLPDVRDMLASKARAQLEQAGLVVAEQVTEKYHERVPVGYVITTDPPPNTEVERSKPITLIVSKGYPPPPSPSEEAEEEPLQVPDRPRRFAVNVTLPPGNEQRIRIEVGDYFGTRNAVDEPKPGGMTHAYEVEGWGDRVIIRVYVNEVLIREVVKEAIARD